MTLLPPHDPKFATSTTRLLSLSCRNILTDIDANSHHRRLYTTHAQRAQPTALIELGALFVLWLFWVGGAAAAVVSL